MPIKVGLQYIDLWQESMEEQVCRYEKEYCEKGQIVFYGPSYFTRWSSLFDMTPVEDMLTAPSGKKCVINRGFGSSCAEHQLYYYPRMIRPLAPKVLVYSSHANGACFGYSDEESWELAQRVIAYARTDFPGIHIYLVGAHPTRDMTEEDLAQRRKYNDMVRNFAKNTPDCTFLDVLSYEPMASKDIFVEDGVHFNTHGYDLYAAFFRQALAEELNLY